MPVLSVYECTQCGVRSEGVEQGSWTPEGWITTVESFGQRQPLDNVWFDKWECVVEYASGRVDGTIPPPEYASRPISDAPFQAQPINTSNA